MPLLLPEMSAARAILAGAWQAMPIAMLAGFLVGFFMPDPSSHHHVIGDWMTASDLCWCPPQ